MKLVLFQRDDCHLCDLALEVLAQARFPDFESVFIDEDEVLETALTALTGKPIDMGAAENPIRAQIRREMAGIDGEWAFEVQLARDPERQPIEDASALWDEAEAPFVQVATLYLPRQDSWDAEAVEQADDRMRFSPWNGIMAHRPLGSVNRARRETYRYSAHFRAEANGCPIHGLQEGDR